MTVNMYKPRLLVVDDEPDNLKILQYYLSNAGYQVDSAVDGIDAWHCLSSNPFKYDLILLDWMMPNMSGIEVLTKIRSHPDLRKVQVIMQTARARSDEVKQGISAGAWYYITKPFEEKTVLDIVASAIRDQSEFKRQQSSLKLVGKSEGQKRFVFRTLNEAQNYATLLAKLSPEPEKVVIGLTELLINAVEHGNLEISYDEKTDLLSEGMWESEVDKRLNDPRYCEKLVQVDFEQISDNEVHYLIRDQGLGFLPGDYLEFTPGRSVHTHGRGIAMAKKLSFYKLQYRGCGNEVLAIAKKL